MIPLLCLCACSGWDRSNPLDPKNPETGGGVTGLALSSIGREVRISWDAVDLPAVTEYAVYRKPSGGRFECIATVSSRFSEYRDPDRPYGTEWLYAVTAGTEAGYQSPLSDSLAILPGPYTFWMCDYYDGSIQRLTYDGRHVIRMVRESIWPTSLAADTLRGRIWAVDYMTGYLYGMTEGENIDLWISGLDNPVLAACDPSRPEIWAADAGRTRIVRFDGEGRLLGNVEGFGRITGLCWSGSPGRFWVADQGRARIELLDRSGDPVMTHMLSCKAPPVLDAYPAERWAVAADSLNIIRIHFTGETDSLAVLDRTCYDLSVDPGTGGCWMILNGPSGEDDAVYLDAEGRILVRTGGFDSALAVAAVPGGEGCLVADTGNGRMVRLNPDGSVLGESTGLVSPWDVILY